MMNRDVHDNQPPQHPKTVALGDGGNSWVEMQDACLSTIAHRSALASLL
jgi:hypothetical protein